MLKRNLSFSKREGWEDDLITIFKYMRDCYSIWKMTTSCSLSPKRKTRENEFAKWQELRLKTRTWLLYNFLNHEDYSMVKVATSRGVGLWTFLNWCLGWTSLSNLPSLSQRYTILRTKFLGHIWDGFDTAWPLLFFSEPL